MSKAGTLVESVADARDRAPIDEMEKLIVIAQRDRGAKQEVLDYLDSIVSDGGDDHALCWLALVAGELGSEGLGLVLDAVGRSDDPAMVDTALIPVLGRHVIELLPAIIRRLHQAEDVMVRAALYEALEAAALVDDQGVKARLRLFAHERWEVEKADPDAAEVRAAPLRLLAMLGEDVSRQLDDARGSRHLTKDDVEDVLDVLRGTLDRRQRTPPWLEGDWRATARHLEVTFGWREQDAKGA
jgi:hypothetical protein